MSAAAFDDLWSKSALAHLAAPPAPARRRLEALVRQVCATPLDFPEAPGRARTLVATAGRVTVLFQVDVLDRLVYVVAVSLRGSA